MKLRFDQNLSFKLSQALSDLFPGSSQVRLLGLAEADDRAVWQHAIANAFSSSPRIPISPKWQLSTVSPQRSYGFAAVTSPPR